MTLRLVADNPRVTPSSDLERVVRRISFAGCSLQRDAAELAHAARIGADFATLSPVHATPGHPRSAPLGWEPFADLVAAARLPVYALGGLEPDDVVAAQMSGAQGIAAIRGLWPA